MRPDFKALRRQFPLLASKTYLCSNSYGALADSVKAALECYIEDRLTLGVDWDGWVGRLESVRALMASLLNCATGEVALTASLSAGINALASALDYRGDRNRIVVSDFEFPTHAQIWHAQEPRGARIVHVPASAEACIPLENFARVIDERTRLVAITHVCYKNGAKLDVDGVVRLAHDRGAQVLLDCYQSVGSMSVDVKALDVDFAAGGMLKYLLGTAGLGFLYVRDSLIPALVPTASGWFAQADIGAMDITGNTPAPSARRFEAGTPPVLACYAAEAALKLILDVGLPAIGERNQALVARCLHELQGIGWASITPASPEQHGSVVAVPSRDSPALCAALMKRNIVTSSRSDCVRASFHFYNDEADIEAFIASMSELRGSLARA